MAHSQLGPETDGILSEFSRIKLGKGGWGVLLMAGNESGVDLSLHHMKALNTKAMASLALAATCFASLHMRQAKHLVLLLHVLPLSSPAVGQLLSGVHI